VPGVDARAEVLYAGRVVIEPGEVVFFSGHPSRLAHPFLYIRALVLALVGGIVAGLASAVADGRVQSGWVVAGVFGVFGLIALRGELRRARVRYAITDRRVRIETGLIARRKRQTRLEWVQEVTMHQSMTQRFLGIGTVVFITEDESELDFRFHGLAEPRRLLGTVGHALPGRIRTPERRSRVGMGARI
jgi:membrane protein YdbS with pleckstrin-like domain